MITLFASGAVTSWDIKSNYLRMELPFNDIIANSVHKSIPAVHETELLAKICSTINHVFRKKKE